MTLSFSSYLIVLPLVFLAGLIDAAAGGGGLISIPAYLAAGLPVHLAAGTNKFSACIGTCTATLRYSRGGYIRWKAGLWAALLALPGSYLGVYLQQMIPDRTLNIVLLCMLPAAAVCILSSKRMTGHRIQVPPNMVPLISALTGLFIGMYDGLIGPGTGTFLIILFMVLLGMDPVNASGTAKIVNLASNLAALVNYAISGQILYTLGLPAALMTILGAMTGARLAMKGGTRVIRFLLIVVLVLLLLTMVQRLFF